MSGHTVRVKNPHRLLLSGLAIDSFSTESFKSSKAGLFARSSANKAEVCAVSRLP